MSEDDEQLIKDAMAADAEADETALLVGAQTTPVDVSGKPVLVADDAV